MREQMGFAFPRPGKATIAIMVSLLFIYVIELLVLRGAFLSVYEGLVLHPWKVVTEGSVWRVVTYGVLHDPKDPMHLLWNLMIFYFFATPLEEWWGRKRFLIANLVFVVSGALLTILVAAMSRAHMLGGLLGSFWNTTHVGASAAVTGLMIAFGIIHWDKTLNLLFPPISIRGRTLVFLVIGIDVLIALSLASNVSSTCHFGGMIGAALLTTGMWNPTRWGGVLKRQRLLKKKRDIERQLRVIEGGKSDGGGLNGGPKNGRGGPKNGSPLN